MIGYREANTLDTLLFFTSKGTYGFVPVYELEDAKWKDVGAHLSSRVKIGPDEKIVNAFVISGFDSSLSLLTLSRGGMIKRSLLKEYEVSRHSRTMVNMKLADGDEVVSVLSAMDEDEVMIVSAQGYITRYPIQLVPLTSLRSKGVKAMNLSDDSVVSACVYHGDEAQLLAVSDHCAMKRIRMSDIPVLGRPTRGIRLCKRVKSKPYVLKHVRALRLQDSFMLLHDGAAQLMQMKDISLMSVEATFSSPVKNTADFCFYMPLERIEAEPSASLPIQEEEDEDSFAEEEFIEGQISLFDE